MVLDAQRGALHPVALVGEHEVAHAARVPPAEQGGERIIVSLFLGDDPHVDPVLPHRLGEDVIEFLLADLAEAVPADLDVR